MANFNDMLQDLVNKDYEELVAFGKIALDKCFPYLKQIDAEHDGFFFLTIMVLSAIGADGKLSVLEKRFLKDVLGLDDDAVDKMLALYSSKTEDLTDVLHDNAPDEYRPHILMFLLCIMAVDEHITREETAFIKKLFE